MFLIHYQMKNLQLQDKIQLPQMKVVLKIMKIKISMKRSIVKTIMSEAEFCAFRMTKSTILVSWF